MAGLYDHIRSRKSAVLWGGTGGYIALIFLRHTLVSMNSTSAIWPAAGILTATLLLTDRKSRPWLLLMGVLVNIAVTLLYGFTPRSIVSVPESFVLAYLIERVCPPGLNFADPRTLALFLTKALIPTCFVCAAIVYALPNPNGVHTTLEAAGIWFMTHGLGAAIAVPIMVTLLDQRRFSTFKRHAWELPLVCVVITALVGVQFALHNMGLSVIMFPLAMFVAFRYGPVGASWVSGLMMAMAALRIYPSLPGQPMVNVAELQWEQLFVTVVFMTSLPAAGILASLRRTRRLLARRTEIARLARSRADAAVRAKSEFLANMSHEIRTPLNGVIGLADALSRTQLNLEQHEMLGMVLSSGRALNALLSDALDLARADSGALHLATEPFDVREAVSAASCLFAQLAQDKGVAFDVSFDVRHDGVAVGDALRIRQIVSNLISNAVKFTSEGSVTVATTLQPTGLGLGELRVRVKDTGPGFDEAVRSRLFKRFEQGDGSVTRKYGGTGLGLAISSRLAQLMGGRIDCDGAPGVGAEFTFTLTLPLADSPQAAEPAVAAAQSAIAPIARPKVLLAEDHPINQRVIQAILGNTVELTIVTNGEAAIEAHAVQTFDLILMDTQMPVMDGLTAIRSIRAREATGTSRTPIVSLTADALPHQVQAALAAGADRHLAKPITADGLLGAMAETLRREAA